MQGNATEIDERNLLQLDALLSHGYGLSPQLVMRSKGLSIEAKALYGYLSSFAGAGDTAFPSTSRILEELDISKNRFYKIRKELISWGFISIETTATSAGLRTVYTLPQNPIAIKTEIDEIANRRNEIKSSLVANLHNEDMVSHKGDSESERLQQLAGNEPCRQSEAKAQNRGSNLKPCLQSEDEGCLQSGDKLYIDTSINPKVSIDRSATRPSDDEVPSNWKVIEGMTDEIRFYIVTGLARAGTADNHDIEVSVMFEVELRFFQGKTIIFREEKIVGRIRLILEGDSFFKGAPFRRPGFLSIAIVTGIHECVEPDDKNRNGESDCIQHGNRCH